jgi:hypothetical protein
VVAVSVPSFGGRMEFFVGRNFDSAKNGSGAARIMRISKFESVFDLPLVTHQLNSTSTFYHSLDFDLAVKIGCRVFPFRHSKLRVN